MFGWITELFKLVVFALGGVEANSLITAIGGVASTARAEVCAASSTGTEVSVAAIIGGQAPIFSFRKKTLPCSRIGTNL